MRLLPLEIYADTPEQARHQILSYVEFLSRHAYTQAMLTTGTKKKELDAMGKILSHVAMELQKAPVIPRKKNGEK